VAGVAALGVSLWQLRAPAPAPAPPPPPQGGAPGLAGSDGAIVAGEDVNDSHTKYRP
jgi:hypothetical protein